MTGPIVMPSGPFDLISYVSVMPFTDSDCICDIRHSSPASCLEVVDR